MRYINQGRADPERIIPSPRRLVSWITSRPTSLPDHTRRHLADLEDAGAGGEHGVAAASFVVTKDVPTHAFVASNPAVPKDWVRACGQRLNAALSCSDCGDRYAEGDKGLVLA